MLLFMCVTIGLEYLNRPVSVEPDGDVVKSLNTEDIISHFKDNKKKAQTEFVEQVIAVKGTVKNINFLNNRHTITLKSKRYQDHFVICDISPKYKETLKSLKTEDTITLVGVCKGYLIDVIMLNCVPINENTDP